MAFRDGTEAAGLSSWRSVYGAPVDKQTLLETVGGGVALVDVDGDGVLDVYLVTGQPGQGSGGARNLLARGLGDGRFVPAPAASGMALSGWFNGVAAADYDNDGFLDLYLTGYGPNRLVRSNGDGTWSSTAAVAGVDTDGLGAGAAWADFDSDGWVDLFVANYIRVDLETMPAPGAEPYCTWKQIPVPCGPRGLPGDRSVLFHNSGDGTFVAVQQETVGADGYYALGAVWGDYDNDGDPDLYVADDQTPNRLFRNDGGTLVEVAEQMGAAYNEDGHPEAGMGTDWGDYDGDGWMDLFVTNFSDESNTLYQNLEGEFFLDATVLAGLALPSFRYLAWGTAFQDLDSDGDPDLFAANGHVYPQVDVYDLVDPYAQRNQLFLNSGGAFTEGVTDPGDALEVAQVSRGAAFGDVDADGDVDVIVGNLDGPPQLLLNELPQGNWIRVRVRGRLSNRAALGARVTVRAAGLPEQVAEVRGGHSFLSQSSLDLHFGLGTASAAEVKVRWPRAGAPWSEAVRVPAGSLLVVDEGASWRTVKMATPGPGVPEPWQSVMKSRRIGF